MYDDDFTDREIAEIIEWAGGKNPQRCNGKIVTFRQEIRPPITPDQAKRNAENFLKGWRCTLADLWRVSPWHPCEDPRKDASLLIATLYDSADYINVVTDFSSQRQADGKEKACPCGAGITLRRDDWLRRLSSHLPPQSAAGCWIRPNPVKGLHGSGEKGAYTDKDVAAFRILLLESDDLPIGLQLSLWSRLALPVAALIASGGRSLHAWVKLDCRDEKEYRETAFAIYELLARFNPCPSNKNPSRLARLPGVKRRLGGIGASEQRLYYLNDDASGRPIFSGG
jgi:hypothetical protein